MALQNKVKCISLAFKNGTGVTTNSMSIDFQVQYDPLLQLLPEA